MEHSAIQRHRAVHEEPASTGDGTTYDDDTLLALIKSLHSIPDEAAQVNAIKQLLSGK